MDSATPGYLKTACDYVHLNPVRRGWSLGEKAFRKELLAQLSERRGAHHYGAELREGEEEKAERLVREELACKGFLTRTHHHFAAGKTAVLPNEFVGIDARYV